MGRIGDELVERLDLFTHRLEKESTEEITYHPHQDKRKDQIAYDLQTQRMERLCQIILTQYDVVYAKMVTLVLRHGIALHIFNKKIGIKALDLLYLRIDRSSLIVIVANLKTTMLQCFEIVTKVKAVI